MAKRFLITAIIFGSTFAICLGTSKSALAQATTSAKCDDGSVITLTTGTDKGKCKQYDWVWVCQDKKGNKTSGGCGYNGKPICSSSTGAAGCTIKKAPSATGKPLMRPKPEKEPSGR